MAKQIETMREAIMKASVKNEVYGECGDPFTIMYSTSEPFDVNGYESAKMYCVQAFYGGVEVSLSLPNKVMLTFTTKVSERVENRKSFEKYGGCIYIHEPLTEAVAEAFMDKFNGFKAF